MTSETINVFTFRDYREFLRAHYLRQRPGGVRLSLREFSSKVGLGSSNYLKLVMDGDRNLTPSMATRFAAGCGLAGRQAEFFCALVTFSQAKTARERDRAHSALLEFKEYRRAHTLERAQGDYHRHWYLPAIRELVARRDFDEAPEWIATRLMPRISVREARQAVKLLLELGLLVRDNQGRLQQRDAVVETPEGPLPHLVVLYHQKMMEQASAAVEQVPREEREIGALTLCLSDEQMRALKRELQVFRAGLAQRYVADDRARRVIQVNFQLFPLTTRE